MIKMRSAWTSQEIIDKARERGWNIPMVLEYVDVISDLDIRILYVMPPEHDSSGNIRRRMRIKYLCCKEPREVTVRLDTIYRRLHGGGRLCARCCNLKAKKKGPKHAPEDIRTRRFKSSVDAWENAACREAAWALDLMPACTLSTKNWWPS